MKDKNKNNAVFTDVLSSLSRYFVIGVLVMLLAICFSGVRFVKSGNVALVLRFGNLLGDTYEEQVHEPGLLLAFPYIIDEVVMVPTGSVIEQKITTHYTDGYMKDLKSNGYVITGDQNIAIIDACVKYKITDPISYALCVKDMEAIINGSVSNAMVEAAAGMSVDDLLTSGKKAYAKNTKELAQEKLDIAKAGITISNIELTKVSMPKEVVSIYEEVNASNVKASTMLEEAEKYRDTMIPEAQEKANKLIADANTQKAKEVSAANKALAEFWGLLEEYKSNRTVVKARIYNQKMTEAISKIGEVKVVPKGDSKIILK